MSNQHISLADVGATIQLTVKENNAVLNIAQATGLQLILRPPQRTGLAAIVRTGTFTANNGADGIIQYVTVAGDIPAVAVGQWSVQAAFTLGGWSGRTVPPDSFFVDGILT